MAESVSHRFNEYLRSAQPPEDLDDSAASIYDVNHEVVQIGKSSADGERCRTQERRSSITRYDIRMLISYKSAANKNNCIDSNM